MKNNKKRQKCHTFIITKFIVKRTTQKIPENKSKDLVRVFTMGNRNFDYIKME